MASELNLSNVGGVFVVLLGGMGLALIVAFCEFFAECKDIASEDQVSIFNNNVNGNTFYFSQIAINFTYFRKLSIKSIL